MLPITLVPSTRHATLLLLGCIYGLTSSNVKPTVAEETLQFQLRSQTETAAGSQRFHQIKTTANWNASETAMIVCDMWDSHHCYRAVQREQEFAPILDTVIAEARRRGVTIIHAPSDCMDAYKDHPGRQRAIDAPAANNYPDEIAEWCHQIPAEENANYPIDQSDGGEDDTPEEHAAWEAILKAESRDPARPWKKQIDLITIDSAADYISDSGTEIWNILQSRGIENVILAGVHTNMCVLGRPFGLRRLSQAGKNVVLVRDMTDTMYNPAAWPYVSHHSGTDLIISHIERHVTPTITSDQLIGGQPFRFRSDNRPHVAMMINESEYETERTLPLFATEFLNRNHRVSMIYGDQANPNHFPGIDLLDEADVLLVSVRRRTPPTEELEVVKRFVAAGKPVIGIRTANHAFLLRNQDSPPGTAQWPSLDADVFGGSYTNHYGNELACVITFNPTQRAHAILQEIPFEPFVAGGSLYKVAPLSKSTTVLLTGKVEGHAPQPVAWTFVRSDGGRSFYTSLGSPADFEHPAFQQLLLNAIDWAVAAK